MLGELMISMVNTGVIFYSHRKMNGFQMHLIGKMNGQIIQFKKKILVQVVIINIHHDIIMVMNGTVNGYLIKLEMIKDEVRQLGN